MSIKSGRLKAPAILLVSSVLYVLLVVSIPFLKVINERSRIWNGYYMLLVPEGDSRADMETALSGAGFTYISKGTATVPFFNYSGIEQVPLRDIQTRFLSFDPRISNYAEGIPSYFSTFSGGESRDIIYVRSDESPLRFALRTGSILKNGGEKSLIVDFNWTGTLVTLGVFFGVIIFFVSWTRLPKVLPVLAALPWIEFFILGADYGGAGPVLLYAAVITVLEYLYPLFLERTRGGDPGKALFVWLGSLLFFSILVSITLTAGVSGWSYTFLVTLYTLLVSGLLTTAFGAFLQTAHGRMEHAAFLPVSILEGTSHAGGTAGVRRILILSALVLVSYILPGITEYGPGYPVPVPVHVRDAEDFSWKSLAALSRRKESGSLPDLSDYLTHMAYQEGFLYNRKYRFPAPNESIEVERYRQEDGEIFLRSECVKQFTYPWYEDIMADASTYGITALLLKQDYPAGVITCQIKKRASLPGDPREQLLVGLLALSPFRVHDTLVRGGAQHSVR